MSLVNEIKCARCDRKYSGVRSRCPYCGARRIGRGKYTEGADNAKGKMLISILILGCLVVAAGVLLFTTPIDDATAALPGGTIEDSTPPSGILDDLEDGNVSLPGENLPSPSDEYEDDPDDLGIPTPPEPPEVRSLTILHRNSRMIDFTAPVGDQLTFTARVEPLGIEEEIIWTSDNVAVFDVVPLNPEGTEARLTMTGAGTANLIVTVGGAEARCVVRVRR